MIIVIKKKVAFSLLILISLLLVIVILSFFSSGLLNVIQFNNKDILQGRTIVIDPGHGGIDGGTHYKTEILEKDINLDIALKLRKELEKKGATVIMTRETDDSLDDHVNNGNRHSEDLNARARIINQSQPELFISIHVNYINNIEKFGPIVFYYRSSDPSKSLAEHVHRNLSKLSAYENNHSKLEKNPLPNNFFVLRNTISPGILVETGFISNEKDRQYLQNEEHQEEIAKMITIGIMEYLSLR
ncbi:N-acetylmuramoyl-L-alanine amidase family protein [Alkaliphilus transvaalensis]|uniref:N-acetylmuramoyl-L-alanine amidase family protein n=1 Tax=Alkaliphilus transvaalensis TaxID=114628 RepID=UPI00055967D3|nr:N-acetylmuramoyl-L-alanine amidase [Alkaliphilus transvaalensis]